MWKIKKSDKTKVVFTQKGKNITIPRNLITFIIKQIRYELPFKGKID